MIIYSLSSKTKTMRLFLHTYPIFWVFIVMLYCCNNSKQIRPAPDPGNSGVFHDSNKQTIPVGGNAWMDNGGILSETGLADWSDPQTVCTIYMRITKPGMLKISLLLHPQAGKTNLKVSLFNNSKTVAVEGNTQKEFFAGEWQVTEPGYIPISVQGISRFGESFGVLSAIVVSGGAVSPELSFVRSNEGDYFYWGRRGPSVHLNYNTRKLDNIEWFYSEVTVPKGNDVMGSYFMANGFNGGYFGMQVNSDKERRILFSVWSPFETDDPGNIPQEDKIVLLKKGENVNTGEFGNEGSGGQSYLVYPWKAGNTYRFLLHGKPEAQNATVYTAYFYAPEDQNWRLIASFKRPKTNTYLTDLYSFLENFIPETGNIQRMALYGNQWVADANGRWTELTQITFTGDETARKNFRKDYAGGVDNGRFYLKNCGFFNAFTPLDQEFTRPAGKVQPVVDLGGLR